MRLLGRWRSWLALQVVGQTADLQEPGRLEEGRELVLWHVNFTAVDELEDEIHLGPGHVAHDDDGALGTRLVEHSAEVGRAGGEHHPVGSKGAALAGQRYVDKELLVEELIEQVLEALDVGIPSEPEHTR